MNKLVILLGGVLASQIADANGHTKLVCESLEDALSFELVINVQKRQRPSGMIEFPYNGGSLGCSGDTGFEINGRNGGELHCSGFLDHPEFEPINVVLSTADRFAKGIVKSKSYNALVGCKFE